MNKNSQNTVLYKALNFRANETTVMLLISTASYTHWIYTDLVK